MPLQDFTVINPIAEIFQSGPKLRGAEHSMAKTVGGFLLYVS